MVCAMTVLSCPMLILWHHYPFPAATALSRSYSVVWEPLRMRWFVEGGYLLTN